MGWSVTTKKRSWTKGAVDVNVDSCMRHDNTSNSPYLFFQTELDFLNAILPENDRIISLSFKNTEQLGQTEFDRKAIYDIYCENEKGEKVPLVLLSRKRQILVRVPQEKHNVSTTVQPVGNTDGNIPIQPPYVR